MVDALKEPAVPLLEESEVVEACVCGFGNDREFPAFMVPSGRKLPVGDDPGFLHHHAQFVADLAVIATGGPARALKDVRKRAAAGADLVSVKLVPRTEDGRRRKRARYIEAPTLALALDYVLDIIARGEHARRLTRCGLETCGKFFFQELGKSRPYAYCPGTDHREIAHKAANPQRAADTRERRKARELLMRVHKARKSEAERLVKGKETKGLKADEMVRLALAARAASKHK